MWGNLDDEGLNVGRREFPRVKYLFSNYRPSFHCSDRRRNCQTPITKAIKEHPNGFS